MKEDVWKTILLFCIIIYLIIDRQDESAYRDMMWRNTSQSEKVLFDEIRYKHKDLEQQLDSISHELLIVRLRQYGFDYEQLE